jgi:hypothetical protein
MLQYYNVMKLKFTINACVINTVKPKYEVVYIQVYGGGMVCPLLQICADIKYGVFF